MTRLRKPRWTYWTLEGKRCKPGTAGAVKHSGQSSCWHGTYKDEHGHEKEVRLSEHKDTAKRMLAELQRQADLARAGLRDPFAAHRRRPLSEHVEEFLQGLAATGRGAKRVARVRQQLQTVFTEAKAELLEHVTGDAVTRAIGRLSEKREYIPNLPRAEAFGLAELAKLLGCNRETIGRAARRLGFGGGRRGKTRTLTREQAQAVAEHLTGFGVGSRNAYLTACKQFSRWAQQERRIPADPLSHLRRQSADADRRHRRRALTQPQFEAFVAAAAGGPTSHGLTGPQRLVLYVTAAMTGLRAGELASLTSQSFDWQRGTVTVEATVSKHRREDTLVLRPDLLEMLRQYIEAGIPASAPLWPGNWHLQAAEMVRGDLEAAGIPYIEGGRVFDFHSLRGLLGSYLAAAGVHPRVAQELMRHSDIKLTMGVYTDLGVLDVRGALDKLPRLPGQKPSGEKGAG